jgi:protein O-GlcNAc transferase
MLRALLAGLAARIRGGKSGATDAAAVAGVLAQARALLASGDFTGVERLCATLGATTVDDPGLRADVLELLGAVALQREQDVVAAGHFDAVLALRGDDARAASNAAEANRRAGRAGRALALAERSLALAPDQPAALQVKALALEELWREDEASACFTELTNRHPGFRRGWTGHLAALGLVGADPLHLLAEHRRWAAQFADALRPPDPGRLRDGMRDAGDATRRLRVGYVSADFRDHAAAPFLLPLFAHHDAAQFEVHAFSGVARPDAVTQRLRERVARWHDVAALDDAAFAERVRAERVDILVDLSGHTRGNRLLAFAREPAPVQLTWLGYPGTTGMAAMHGRITDALTDPAPQADERYVERLHRLPGSLWCFEPDARMPAVAPPPCAASGVLTFGSMNFVRKLRPATIALWARLLRELPESRLLLATVAPDAQDALAAAFVAHGIARERLAFRARLSREAFWDLHHEIDIALDTWPVNGGATTCETLWMGVPVVSFPGDTFASRAGLSILHSAGLDELVAADEEGYVRLAASLARDRARLAQLRASMRDRLLASPLLAAEPFTRSLEALYRAAWQEACKMPENGISA